jgi:hypothetical protein
VERGKHGNVVLSALVAVGKEEFLNEQKDGILKIYVV